MKKIGFLFILSLNLFNCIAQSDSSSAVKVLKDSMSIASTAKPQAEETFVEFARVEFNPGFSLPTGNFASGDYTNPMAGYAKEGYSLGANFSIKVFKGLSIIACYSRQVNVFDERSFAVNALESKKNYTLEAISNWKNHFVLAGVTYDIPLEDDNFLTPRILFGTCLGRSPEYEMVPNTNNLTATTREVVKSESSVAFAMKVGVGLKKNLTKQLFVTINPDFYYSSLKLNINKSFTNIKNPSQSVSIVSLSISLGFRMYR